jgi:DNA ligase (NAD+)
MKIEIPTNCPSCSFELIQINSQLFCKNNACPAQTSKKIEAFAKNMKIKGLGPSTISKLDIEFIPELYELTEDFLKERLGEKIGLKIYTEIQNSRDCEFSTFLASLSIPLIGNVAAEKLATQCNSIDELQNVNIETILGPKAAENVSKWINEEAFYYRNLPINFMEIEKAKPSVGKVVITGKLENFSNRKDAEKYLKSIGYTLTSTLSSKTNYLINEDGKQSSKMKKAESLNIPIVTIKQLEEM